MVGVLPKLDSPDGAILEDFRLSLWKPFQDNYEDKWDQGLCDPSRLYNQRAQCNWLFQQNGMLQ